MTALHFSRATAIFVVDCCQFGPSWIYWMKIEIMACAGLVGFTMEPFFLTLYDIINYMRYFGTVYITPKPAQTLSSIFSPNIQLGPNWQQSTTKMAVARLRCDGDSSAVFHIIDTII